MRHCIAQTYVSEADGFHAATSCWRISYGRVQSVLPIGRFAVLLAGCHDYATMVGLFQTLDKQLEYVLPICTVC